MSVLLPLDKLTDDQKRRINRDLKIKPKLNFMQKKFSQFNPVPPVFAYEVVEEEQKVFIPFNYAYKLLNEGKKKKDPVLFPNDHIEFDKREFTFTGTFCLFKIII